MKKEELTRRKILFLTSSHRFYFNAMFIFAIVCSIPFICDVTQGMRTSESSLLLIAAVGCIIIGILCCLTYFIDILTMNIKTVEEDSRELLETISHAKRSVGNRIKVNSKNKGSIKLFWYDKVYDRAKSNNSRYEYKTIWYYLGLSEVVVFREDIPIGEKKEYNPKKRR